MNCDTARAYCGAVADGEYELVPLPERQHIAACHQCAVEVQWQREAGRAVVGALAEVPLPFPAMPARRAHRARPWPALGLGALAAAAAVLVIASVIGGRGPTPGAPRATADAAMGDAALAYGRPAAFISTDAAAIAGWSLGKGIPVEVMSLPDEVPTGARVSLISGHDVVTVIYTGAHGTMEVTVLPAAMTAGWPAMEATRVGATPVGIVHRSTDGVIVVTPDPGALHSAMTTLQAV